MTRESTWNIIPTQKASFDLKVTFVEIRLPYIVSVELPEEDLKKLYML